MDLKAIMAGTDKQDQNLINTSKINTDIRPVGYWKAICLDIVSVGAAALFGFTYYRYLTAGVSVWFLFGALTFFAVTSAMQVFLARSTERRLLIILLETIAAVGWFWRDNVTILVLTTVIMLGIFVWGYISAHIQLKNSVEIPFFGTTGNVLSKFTTATLLFMILIYVPNINGNALVVSQKSFGTFFDWTSGLLSTFYPQLALNGTFGDFAQSFSKMELQNNPNFQSLSSAQQSTAINQQAAQFTETFSAGGSSTIATSSPASDAFYSMLNGVLSAWQSQSSGWFDLGWVTLLFIGLRAVGVLFVWLAQFVTLIFYEILFATGFIKVAEETRSQEVLGY